MFALFWREYIQWLTSGRSTHVKTGIKCLPPTERWQQWHVHLWFMSLEISQFSSFFSGGICKTPLASVPATVPIPWRLLILHSLNRLMSALPQRSAACSCSRKTCQRSRSAPLPGSSKKLTDENILLLGFAKPRGAQPNFREETTLPLFSLAPNDK